MLRSLFWSAAQHANLVFANRIPAGDRQRNIGIEIKTNKIDLHHYYQENNTYYTNGMEVMNTVIHLLIRNIYLIFTGTA